MSPPVVTKKLVGPSVDTCAADALEGLVAVNPGLRLLGKTRNVIREDLEEIRGKVAVVCGGGSGHEPFAAGYVGKGMLAAAIPGPIFASPPPHQAYPLFLHMAQFEPSGILMFVFNYTGDRLNFGLAVERAKRDGINVEMFVNGDDTAKTGAKMAGRRGMAGNLLLIKIAGAMAEEEASMEDILKELESASKSLGTIGVALTPCSLPGQPPLFTLGPEDMELGLGVHGEAGIRRMHVQPVAEVIATMFDHMTSEENENRLPIESEDEVVLLVNNLGGTSKLEELIVCREAIAHLEHENVGVLRAYNGHFMTSLEMAGVQLSVFKLGSDESTKKRWLSLLDTPTEAPAWPRVVMSKKSADRFTPCRTALMIPKGSEAEGSKPAISVDQHELVLPAESVLVFENAVKAAAEALQLQEFLLNELDSGAGDGDCGSTICRGVRGIVAGVNDGSIDLKRPQQALAAISDVCATEMGGTSGALYSLFFAGAARCLQQRHMASSMNDLPRLWIDSFAAGVENMKKYGGADVGDRTMLDALAPALNELQNFSPASDELGEVLKKTAEVAEKGAESTIGMQARAGRASYVGDQKFTNPDPGATAVAVWIRAVCDSLVKDFTS